MLNIKDTRFVSTFEVEPVEGKNVVKANLSTSKKNGQEYINMYWKGRFVGQAYDKALTLQHGSKIDIINGVIENNYDKENKKAWYTVTIFDFELSEKKESQN